MDNAFAVFDLLMEWFTFSSLGLKGAAGVAWGSERRCQFTSEAATTSSQIAPRGDFETRGERSSTNGRFPADDGALLDELYLLLCCAFCISDGKTSAGAGVGSRGRRQKLSPFSKAGSYFNGIKIVSAAVAPGHDDSVQCRLRYV